MFHEFQHPIQSLKLSANNQRMRTKYLWNDCLKSALNFVSSSVIDPNCFKVISASAEAMGLLLISANRLCGTIWKIFLRKWDSLVFRIFRKRQSARFVGNDSGFFGFYVINRVVNRLVASTVAAELAELLQRWNVIFGKEDGRALVLLYILLVPRVVARARLNMFRLRRTGSHFVEAIRQLTGTKQTNKENNFQLFFHSNKSLANWKIKVLTLKVLRRFVIIKT